MRCLLGPKAIARLVKETGLAIVDASVRGGDDHAVLAWVQQPGEAMTRWRITRHGRRVTGWQRLDLPHTQSTSQDVGEDQKMGAAAKTIVGTKV